MKKPAKPICLPALLQLLSLLLLLLTSGTALAQDISRKQADSLLKLAPGFKAGVPGVQAALKLSVFFINKDGATHTDLDSATYFLKQAKVFNKKESSVQTNGYLLLTEAYLIDARGNAKPAQTLAKKAYDAARLTQDKPLLGKA